MSRTLSRFMLPRYVPQGFPCSLGVLLRHKTYTSPATPGTILCGKSYINSVASRHPMVGVMYMGLAWKWFDDSDDGCLVMPLSGAWWWMDDTTSSIIISPSMLNMDAVEYDHDFEWIVLAAAVASDRLSVSDFGRDDPCWYESCRWCPTLIRTQLRFGL